MERAIPLLVFPQSLKHGLTHSTAVLLLLEGDILVAHSGIYMAAKTGLVWLIWPRRDQLLLNCPAHNMHCGWQSSPASRYIVLYTTGLTMKSAKFIRMYERKKDKSKGHLCMLRMKSPPWRNQSGWSDHGWTNFC